MCANEAVLFRVLEIQSGNADFLRRRGQLRPASASLDRAFKQGSLSAKAGLPAGRLACASACLQSCAMLSQADKHTEALEQACTAVLELDRLWQDLTKAHGKVQAAVRDNVDVGYTLDCMPAPMSKILQHPPKWLEQAVTSFVEAKHAVALELEYCVLDGGSTDAFNMQVDPHPRTCSASGHRAQSASSERPATAPAGGNRARVNNEHMHTKGVESATVVSDDPAWAVTVRSAGFGHLKDPWGLINQLHTEALALAEQLLPRGHPVRESSQRTEWQARLRQAGYGSDAWRGQSLLEVQEMPQDVDDALAIEGETAEDLDEDVDRQPELQCSLTSSQYREDEQSVDDAPIPRCEQMSPPLGRPKSAVRATSCSKALANEAAIEPAAEPEVVTVARAKALVECPAHLTPDMCLSMLPQTRPASAPAGPRAVSFDARPTTGVARPSSATGTRPAPSVATRQGVAAKSVGSAGNAGVAAKSVGSAGHAASRPCSALPARTGSAGRHPKRERGPNLFEEWKQEKSSYNSMSYIQKKMASESGIQDMKQYFKREQQRFVHGYLKEANPDVLYDNRVHFSPSMVAMAAEKRRHHDREERQNKPVEGPAGGLPATPVLAKQMRRTWKSLYGFRDVDGPESKKKDAVAVTFGLPGGRGLLGEVGKRPPPF